VKLRKREIHGLNLMMINTNVAAQSSASLLGESSRLLAKSLARLTSGSRLTSPEADAAGMAVSMRFDAQINRTSATLNNLGNAISLNQTQDGFLKKIGKSLDRMSELAVLAQDITKTDSDRGLDHGEISP
jgi:flagellin